MSSRCVGLRRGAARGGRAAAEQVAAANLCVTYTVVLQPRPPAGVRLLTSD
jgi:hypothetical protein